MRNQKKLKKVINDDFDKDTNFLQIMKRIEKKDKQQNRFKLAYIAIICSLLIGVFYMKSNVSDNTTSSLREENHNDLITEEAISTKPYKKDPSMSYDSNNLVLLYYEGDINIYTQGLKDVMVTIDGKKVKLKEYLRKSKKSSSEVIDEIIRESKNDNNYKSDYFEVYYVESNMMLLKCKDTKKVHIGTNKMIIDKNLCEER